MNLKFEKQVEDKRGKILFFSFGNKKFNIVETKQGFARGGHFHNFLSTHILVNGKVEVIEEDLNTGIEQTKKNFGAFNHKCGSEYSTSFYSH